MATYPKAELRLIKPGANDPRITPVGIVLHVADSHQASLFDWFNGPSGGIEAHVYVRADGTIEQYRDFDFEADAQSAGNSWLVNGQRFGLLSVETDGKGTGTWTSQQVVTLIDLIKWTSARYGFPVQQITSSQPISLLQGGVGWHALYNSWNPKSKSCPGPDRIAQIPAIIAAAQNQPTGPKEYHSPVIREVVRELRNPDSALSRALRNNIRLATQAELKDEREGKNP